MSDEKSNTTECCTDLTQRELLEERPGHLRIERCQGCGRKHYRMVADVGQLGAQLPL